MYQPRSLKIENIISFKEQEFTFRNGKAIAIVGENLDDDTQNGNGSGKSALIEAISLAIFGTSIRKVKVKELINNESDYGAVELILYNTENCAYFKISRKLYANSKSAEYEAATSKDDKKWKDCGMYYSDANMFNDFIWNTLGIGKEDFQNFFLITKENYTPFLLVGDVKKKEIINRFSGADKVDEVFPYIKEDSDNIAKEILELERSLVQNQTRQEVLAEQMIEEETKNSEEEREKSIKSKEIVLETLVQDAEVLEETVDEKLVDVEIATKALGEFKFSIDYEEKLQSFIIEKEQVETTLKSFQADLVKVKDKFKPEIDEIKDRENKHNIRLKELRSELEETEQFESDIQKSLQDSIECPKCHHKFILRDKEFNIEEAKAQLPEIKTLIEELKDQIAVINTEINVTIPQNKLDVNQKIIKKGESIRKEIEVLNQSIAKIGEEELQCKRAWQTEKLKKQQLETAINNAQLEHDKAVKAYKNVQESIKDYNTLIEKLRNQENDNSKIEELQKQVEGLIKDEEKIVEKIDLKRKRKEEVDAWELYFKSFKSHLANKSIRNIQDYTNMFLQNMGSNLSINIDGYKTLSNKKIKETITTSVLRDGFDAGSYGKFSGGERARIDLCCCLALQELINLNSSTGGIDLLIADEVLESLDADGMEATILSLQDLGKSIMLISQLEIPSVKDHTVIVRKKNKQSVILN